MAHPPYLSCASVSSARNARPTQRYFGLVALVGTDGVHIRIEQAFVPLEIEPADSMSLIDHNLTIPAIGSSQDAGRLRIPVWTGKQGSENVSLSVLTAMAVVSALLVPSRMLLSRGEPDDSAVFAYVGWTMKHGLMPYRDIWDHKGPLLYYLQYAGMSLRSTSTFGIGLLELIAFSIAFFLMYRVIASFASRFVGFAIAAFSVTFVTRFTCGGNMTETWTLLPLAAAHYACWRWSQRTSQSWCAPLIGGCFACIFWLRPNMTTYPAIAMLVVLYVSRKSEGLGTAMKQLAMACAAAVGISALIVAPLYGGGVFHDFVAAYFGYNAAYSGALSLASRRMHTTQLMMELFATAIALLGAAGWALGIRESRQKREVGSLPSLYLRTLLWSLPFEIAAASLSGRDYLHYLLPLFPSMVVLAAWFLSEFERQARAIPARRALTGALLAGLCPFAFASYSSDFAQSTAPQRSDYLEVVSFIQHATKPSDKITVVGITEAPYIAFLAQRLPASRFVYQLPLIDANNPIAGEQRKQFLCDIAQNQPAVIVSGNPLMGILCATELECTLRNLNAPVNDYGYQSMVLPKLMQNVIASKYRPVSNPKFGTFRVLLRNDIAVPSRW